MGYDWALIARLEDASHHRARDYRCPFVDAIYDSRKAWSSEYSSFTRVARELLAEPWVERAPGARASARVKGSDQPVFAIAALWCGEFEAR